MEWVQVIMYECPHCLELSGKPDEVCGECGEEVEQPLTSQIKATAGDNIPAEIAYYDADGKMVGYWAYGSWEPGYPYQGQQPEPEE